MVQSYRLASSASHVSVSVRNDVGNEAYRCAAQVRNGVSRTVFGGIAQQDVCLSVVVTLVRGLAVVGGHTGRTFL